VNAIGSASTARGLARSLSEVLVSGRWDEADLLDRALAVLGRRPRWLAPLIRRILIAFPATEVRPSAARLVHALLSDERFRRVCARRTVTADLRRPPPPVMWPAPGIPPWPVPPIATPEELAGHLEVGPAELEWFADRRGILRRAPDGQLRHYVCRWVPKRGGSARLIASPKPRLKAIQRRILDEILSAIPPHDAAHGFRLGRSIRTFAAPHVGRHVVLKMDLQDFFTTVGASRVAAIFLALGYPDPVARLLTGLCTHAAAADIWSDPMAPAGGRDAWRLRRMYADPHLPQGAPTSPALANLAAYRLDARLSALAASAGATYTRYADDLAFSGGEDFARALGRFPAHVGAVALEEGLAVNPRKTRILRRGVRQQVAGVVVNDRPNVPRDEFDRLKATLHNCAARGPSDQNRDGVPDFRAHLLGRIAHVALLNPERGRRLRAIFDRIAW
jgi:hypothetical protein